MRFGHARALGEFGAAIEQCAAESDAREGRYGRAAHVPAAENDGSRGQRDGHHETAVNDGSVLKACDEARLHAALSCQRRTVGIEQRDGAFARLFAFGTFHDEIGRNALVNAAKHFACGIAPMRIAGIHGRVQKSCIPAAGHIEAFFGGEFQFHVLDEAQIASQHATRFLDGVGLDGAAANGAARKPVFVDEHLRARVSWRGAFTFHYGNQHQIACLARGTRDMFCNRSHVLFRLCFRERVAQMKNGFQHAACDCQAFVRYRFAVAHFVARIDIAALQALGNARSSSKQAS